MAIFGRMLKSFEFSLPTNATTVASAPDWLHEIKYDGYRLRLERDGDHMQGGICPRYGVDTLGFVRLLFPSRIYRYWPVSEAIGPF